MCIRDRLLCLFASVPENRPPLEVKASRDATARKNAIRENVAVKVMEYSVIRDVMTVCPF